MTKHSAQSLVEWSLIIAGIAILVIVILGGVGAAVYGFYVRITGAQPWVY